jgi:hypothetical protein
MAIYAKAAGSVGVGAAFADELGTMVLKRRRFHPPYSSLQAAGKATKLALTACARKLLTILRDGKDYVKQAE